MTAPQEARQGPRLERFSPKAREVLESAPDEARRLGQNHIGTEHILLALSAIQDDPVRQTLDRFGITHDRVRKEIRSMGLDKSNRGHFKSKVEYATRAARVAGQFAPEAAAREKSSEITASNLLRALTREKEAAAARILQTIAPGLEEVL